MISIYVCIYLFNEILLITTFDLVINNFVLLYLVEVKFSLFFFYISAVKNSINLK